MSFVGGFLCGASLALQLVSGEGCWAPYHPALSGILLFAAVIVVAASAFLLLRSSLGRQAAPGLFFPFALGAAYLGFAVFQDAAGNTAGSAISLAWCALTAGLIMLFTGWRSTVLGRTTLLATLTAIPLAVFSIAIIGFEVSYGICI